MYDKIFKIKYSVKCIVNTGYMMWDHDGPLSCAIQHERANIFVGMSFQLNWL